MGGLQVVGCNGALMGMLPWLFGAFLADFRTIRWSWLQLPLAVAAILLHLIIAILQVLTAWLIPQIGISNAVPAGIGLVV